MDVNVHDDNGRLVARAKLDDARDFPATLSLGWANDTEDGKHKHVGYVRLDGVAAVRGEERQRCLDILAAIERRESAKCDAGAAGSVVCFPALAIREAMTLISADNPNVPKFTEH